MPLWAPHLSVHLAISIRTRECECVCGNYVPASECVDPSPGVRASACALALACVRPTLQGMSVAGRAAVSTLARVWSSLRQTGSQGGLPIGGWPAWVIPVQTKPGGVVAGNSGAPLRPLRVPFSQNGLLPRHPPAPSICPHMDSPVRPLHRACRMCPPPLAHCPLLPAFSFATEVARMIWGGTCGNSEV